MNNIANMKWHGLYLTVAAFMLITLPIKGVSEHCREDTWNQALNFQKQVESWYNKKASKFNQFLAFHKQQAFLYQEFSTEELSALWDSKNELHQKRILSQSKAATIAVARLQEEGVAIHQQSSIIDRAYDKWKNIYTHCNEAELKINSSSSQHYMNVNLTLKKETESLQTKIDVMIKTYRREIEVIEELKP
ncbi:hypothetical protein [Vibrio coralliilyticus]|nr:hypothetical protein [Vibrio coralliilyticus]